MLLRLLLLLLLQKESAALVPLKAKRAPGQGCALLLQHFLLLLHPENS